MYNITNKGCDVLEKYACELRQTGEIAEDE